MISKRLASNRLEDLLEHFPAVLLLGARQIGKTTLVRLTFPNAETLDLESLWARLRFAKKSTQPKVSAIRIDYSFPNSALSACC